MPSLPAPPENTSVSRVFFAGNVMIGRGVDQTFRYKVNPILYEDSVKDARHYVTLATNLNGDFPENRSVDYVWGDSIEILNEMKPDVRIINLETAITKRGLPTPNKPTLFRMHPNNVEVIQAASIDCCVLANDHTLDWGTEGLEDTLDALRNANIKTAGAGRNWNEVLAPAIFEIPGNPGRILVFGIGTSSAGVPMAWSPAPEPVRAGMCQMEPTPEPHKINLLQSWIYRHRKPKDVVIFSVHWGGRLGYTVDPQHREFAYRLIDYAGVDLVYGHSSQHIRGLEVYKGKLIFYGCGDFINDNEGEEKKGNYYRDDYSLMYFADLDHENSGQLVNLFMVPMCLRKMQVIKAGPAATWHLKRMKRQCGVFGGDVEDRDGYFQFVKKT